MSTPPVLRPSLAANAELCAYVGLLPLVLSPLGIAFLPSYALRELSQQLALGYGAVVLATLGGVHWGMALAGRMSWTPARILGAVLPAVCGAVSVAAAGQLGLAILVIGLGVFWLYEHRVVGSELPEVYLRLRRNLTLAGCSLLAVSMFVSESVGLL
ncbi:MAG TPA: DUF3429 domain-containing protein [Steroidobacteraceae bacterium]|nr:DUF3429 domain-containing protein [Steroidobacteraceae bacterium]